MAVYPVERLVARLTELPVPDVATCEGKKKKSGMRGASIVTQVRRMVTGRGEKSVAGGGGAWSGGWRRREGGVGGGLHGGAVS